jgi:hypothetical protein
MGKRRQANTHYLQHIDKDLYSILANKNYHFRPVLRSLEVCRLEFVSFLLWKEIFLS